MLLKPSTKTPLGPVAWVALCAFLNCTGWVLSACHALNLVGYSIAFVLAAVLVFLFWKTGRLNFLQVPCLRKERRRFRRLFPKAFLTLAILAFLGGMLHAPSNYDALSYRVPRILHWLAAEQWHWIHTDFHRLNVRACGIEWVSTPIILFTKSDRGLFLINTISFLLIPGLVFSVFRRLGVCARAAWYWMWLMPAGLCFALQAGSISNDMFGAVLGLGALDLALRARTSGRVSDVWFSILAAALLTASKTSNLPLLLPWALALLPAVGLVRKQIIATAAVCVVGVGASFLPVAALNVHYCNDWAGTKAEHTTQFSEGPALLHVEHNIVLLVVQNFAPPVFPIANVWNRAVQEMMPPAYVKKVEATYEPSGAHFSVTEMQMEEEAGLGMGLSILLLISFVAKLMGARSVTANSSTVAKQLSVRAVRYSGYFSLLVFMVKSGLSAIARLIIPYYAFLMPAMLVGEASAKLARKNWWQRLGMLVFLITAGMLIISPARPLWPARTVVDRLQSNSVLVQRAKIVYDVYGERADAFALMTRELPADAVRVGLISFDDPETSLWRPFGKRRIEHVLAAETAEELRRRGIQYVLVNPDFLLERSGETPEQWLNRNHADAVKVVPLTLRASRGPVNWTLARLRAD